MYEDSIGEIATKLALNSVYVFGSRASEIARCISSGAGQPRSGAHLSAQESVQLMQALEDLFGAPRVDLIVLPEANSFLAVDAIRGQWADLMEERAS